MHTDKAEPCRCLRLSKKCWLSLYGEWFVWALAGTRRLWLLRMVHVLAAEYRLPFSEKNACGKTSAAAFADVDDEDDGASGCVVTAWLVAAAALSFGGAQQSRAQCPVFPQFRQTSVFFASALAPELCLLFRLGHFSCPFLSLCHPSVPFLLSRLCCLCCSWGLCSPQPKAVEKHSHQSRRFWKDITSV